MLLSEGIAIMLQGVVFLQKGDQAITYYKVEKYFKKQNTTLVTLQLETGRTHQIRVHMSHNGNPLVGGCIIWWTNKIYVQSSIACDEDTFLASNYERSD